MSKSQCVNGKKIIWLFFFFFSFVDMKKLTKVHCGLLQWTCFRAHQIGKEFSDVFNSKSLGFRTLVILLNHVLFFKNETWC